MTATPTAIITAPSSGSAPFPTGTAPPRATGQIALQGRVLLAEDGVDNQQIISLYLRKAGADVVIAENGRIAVDLAMSRPLDLILMDIDMPELDGYDATRQLRAAAACCRSSPSRLTATPTIATNALPPAAPTTSSSRSSETSYWPMSPPIFPATGRAMLRQFPRRLRRNRRPRTKRSAALSPTIRRCRRQSPNSSICSPTG